MTKLVAWIGGPEVMESKRFVGEFIAPRMTLKQWLTIMSTFEGDFDNIDVIIPLEVDE